MSHPQPPSVKPPSLEPPSLTDLIDLARRAARPLSITGIIHCVNIGSHYEQFRNNVNALFPPEQAQTIFAHTDMDDQVIEFTKAFEDRYFPLADHITDDPDWDEPIVTIINTVFPYQLMGLTSEEIHDVWTNGSTGIATLLLLIDIDDLFKDSPYSQYDNNIRTSWMESAQDVIDFQVLARIPHTGLPQDKLAKAVEDSPYQAIAKVAPWIFAMTQNPFLSISYEDQSYNHDVGENYFDPDLVESLALDWEDATQTIDGVAQITNMIEKDPSGTLSLILDHILSHPALAEDNPA